MFKILWVELTNFRSFVGTHKWALNGVSGLFYLTGKNDDNPRLGRNGIGKSSLLDAISWCLFGKTTRSLRGTDIISRGCSTCSVSVALVVDNEELIITATQSPNSLKINGEGIDREALVKKLRLNFESFLYSIIIPQAGNSFLDLSPGEKLTLFSQIMELDFWLEKSAQAHDEAGYITNEIERTEREIAQLSGRVAAIKTNMEELKIKQVEFDKKKVEKVEQLTEELARATLESKRLSEELLEAEAEIAVLVLQLKGFDGPSKELESDIGNLNAEIAEANKELAIIDHKIETAKKAEVKFGQVGLVCPTCKQKVDEKHIIKELEKVKKEIKELKSEKDAFLQVKDEIKANKDEITLKVTNYNKSVSDIRAADIKAKGNKNALENELRYLERESIRLGLEIKKTKDLRNDFTDMVLKKRNELSTIIDTIEVKKVEIAKLNEEYAAVHYWVAGFKRLRLYIIEETLRTLEIEVNNSLVTLGLGDWKIEFDIERENKSGGITKGFITLITDPKGYTAKYETLSFGETQRVKLAGGFGLSNLIMERVGLISGTELYDEPSVHMTDEGIEDTLNALRDRALATNREIWVIDNIAMNYGDFNGTVNLIKDENGSRF